MKTQITAKYQGKCKKCGKPISPGERIWWHKEQRGVQCTSCGNEDQPKNQQLTPLKLLKKLRQDLSMISAQIEGLERYLEKDLHMK